MPGSKRRLMAEDGDYQIVNPRPGGPPPDPDPPPSEEDDDDRR